MTKKEVSKNKNWIKWVLLGVFLMTVLVSAKLYKDQKMMADRKYIMQRQRDLMTEAWKEEGLTEEEVKERMDAMRQRRDEMGDSLPEGFKPPEGVMKMRKMMK